MDRAAFLAERQTGIGGSDAASLFNLGWGCARRLWYDKTGAEPDFPREDTAIMEIGRLLEPMFARRYAELTGRKVSLEATFERCETADFLVVHVDGWVEDAGREFCGIVEIKSVGRGAWFKYKRDGLPEDYVLQLQHGMGVTGCTWGAFIIGCRDSGEILHWDVEFKPQIWDEIVSAGTFFWEKLKTSCPDRLEPDDSRCQNCAYRTTCQGENIAIGAAGPQSAEGYELDDSLGELLAERQKRKALEAEAKSLVEDINEELKAALGARTLVCTSKGDKVQFYEIKKAEYVVPAHTERPLRHYAPKEKKGKK